MPGKNGTGPKGMGPMSGSGTGCCLGAAKIDSFSVGHGRGCGRGLERRSNGGGGQRCRRGAAEMTAEPENLRRQVDSLQEQLDLLRRSLDEMATAKHPAEGDVS